MTTISCAPPSVPETLTESFVQQYKSGAQGCSMDHEAAQQLALAIEAQRKALRDLLDFLTKARSPDVTVRMKDFTEVKRNAQDALEK